MSRAQVAPPVSWREFQSQRSSHDTISTPSSGRSHPGDVIAGILNRQGRTTANGERFTANQVGSLRR